MNNSILNIPQGCGAFIVVRDRENLLHGEGRHVVFIVKLKEVCGMQKAELVLTILSEKSRENPDYKFKRLYRNLFNEDFYFRAYAKINNGGDNLTKGADIRTGDAETRDIKVTDPKKKDGKIKDGCKIKSGKKRVGKIKNGRTINSKKTDGLNIEKLRKLIAKIKTERYSPSPVNRIYASKKNRGTGFSKVPNFNDRLVQEVIRQILGAIYEPNFHENSHGFRPNKGPQTALYQIKQTCRGADWVIKGKIRGFFDDFDNIRHQKLLDILGEKIDDGRLINLIGKFLRAGYMEHNIKQKIQSDISRGNSIGPILMNIYFNKLDLFIDNINFNGIPEGIKQEGKNLNLIDPHFRKIEYIRYADNFIVFVRASKKIALDIKACISEFLSGRLNIGPCKCEIQVTNLRDRSVRFLGYEISKNSGKPVSIKGTKKKAVNGAIQLLVPNEVITERLKPFTRNGKPVHHNARINLSVLDIIDKYNSEIRELYNYYNLAADVNTKIGKFKYFHYRSLAKTIARKEKCSVKKVINKYGINVNLKQKTGTKKIIGIRYNTGKNEQVLKTYFNDPIKKVDKPSLDIKYII